jgi:hypothetical protein
MYREYKALVDALDELTLELDLPPEQGAPIFSMLITSNGVLDTYKTRRKIGE